ncbi:SDR family NAD(P)-dependent oxidoreductase [Phytoactinopolyspora alkaliphila]|uniref:SDR family NAD(P)-dependent oxidoreductase n=1 Tax=Phytoactinopolyspora alkaliphila TaxID=1783498 RepID=A0A6N9YPN4_9ACTN|nr:SDR family NAD(P)-dependent oxidoreductase [Phytoactinopolyspora alkaliphila]NED96895.1 SDR family NAD(P)-dependent oxidoreductase [Phytoactinopolyspora alkaliphila]
MRVMVTGGTGFVGSHTVAALMAAGHDVTLLVRSAERLSAALAPWGITDPPHHVTGDVTDPDSVRRALDGCDAALHAASVYSLDSRAHRATRDTNVRGTGIVLQAALEQGCDPVVHVSSTAALLRRRAIVVPDAPLSTARGVYTRSKAESERIARRWQAEGAPVVIVQPGGVIGPGDPHLSDQMLRLRNVLRGQYPMWPREGFHACDVRDVARLHAAVLEPGHGGRRYIVPGHHLDGRTYFGALHTVTGRRMPHVLLPSVLMLGPARVASAAQRLLPFHVPLEYEGALVTWHDTRCDDSRARHELGIQPRSLVDSFAGAVRWLHDAGHLTAKQAGHAVE